METEKTAVYNNQRVGGVWLVYIGIILVAAALTGRELLIQPFIMGFGFFAGYILIFGLPYISRKLSYGKNTKFQDRMDNFSVFLSIALCTLLGMTIGFDNPRTTWLLIFLIIGLHFFGFYFSQGKWMVLLGVLMAMNASMGLILPSVSFLFFAIIDALLKILFGIKFFSMKREDVTV